MALDSKYILMQDIFEVLTDKDTGLVLAGGRLEFYKDNARNQPKSVFKLSGTPSYNYVDVGNEITLNDAGYPDDAIYYYPYDADGNIELYFIQVFSSDDIPQPTREAWPNTFANNITEESITINLVPNGQFLLHNNLPATDLYDAGEVRAEETAIAPGGWYFVRSDNDSTDIVTFDRYDEYEAEPPANPRYAININVEIPDVEQTVKDLRLRYDNVNRFASDTQGYTYSFWGKCNTGTVECQIILIKNFGTGGSSFTETLLDEKTLTTIDQQFYINFVFGANDDKTLGPDNDDYLDLVVRVPTDAASNTTCSDFYLNEGTFSVDNPAEFPQTTDTQFQYRSLAPNKPDYDGDDLYLPLILTPAGVAYDHSQIGKIFATIEEAVNIGELSCMDGAKYEYAGYSDDGIPYTRLGNKLWDNTNKVYKFGGGSVYLTAVYTGSGASFWITNNSNGSVTNTADGTPATGFTFSTIHAGSNYYCKAYKVASNTIYVQDLQNGNVTNASDQNSGLTISTIQSGTSLLPEITSITAVAASSITAGHYFHLYTYNAGNTQWYVWFKKDGSGSDPTGGGTGIMVDIATGDSASTVAEKLREALNGWQMTLITAVAASSIPAGAYFTVHSTGNTYAVWYEKDGAGSQPVVGGAILIKVAITASMTADDVVAATQEAINRKYYATPLLAGAFLRGRDNSSGNDPDASSRWSLVPGIIGDTIGTLQNSANLSHFHVIQSGNPGSVALTFLTDDSDTLTHNDNSTDYSGGQESRPYNIYVNYVIKY